MHGVQGKDTYRECLNRGGGSSASCMGYREKIHIESVSIGGGGSSASCMGYREKIHINSVSISGGGGDFDG